jgi:sugar phosphate isomerase/epimerase
MPLPIGLQLYTVRDILEGSQLGETCEKLAQFGYTHAEVGPFSGHTTEQVTKAARDAGMTVIGSHEGGLRGEDGKDVAKMLADLGIKYGLQPATSPNTRNLEGYKATAAALSKIDVPGVTIGYHNHDWEFQKVDGDTTGYDLLFDGNALVAEMDTCWVEVAGYSAVEQMQKLSGRVPLLHIKDCGDYDKKTLCELGDGKVPVQEIVAAADGVGVECLIVEQDNNWMNDDPLASAKKSYEYLASIL